MQDYLDFEDRCAARQSQDRVLLLRVPIAIRIQERRINNSILCLLPISQLHQLAFDNAGNRLSGNK
jgi:hypothetical protein